MRKSVLIMVLAYAGIAHGVDVSVRDRCRDTFDKLTEKVKAEPANEKAWREFRVCVTELKRWHDGDVAATQALKLNPNQSEAHLLQGVTRLHSKAYDKAVESFDETIRLNPQNAQAYYYLGMAYLFQSQPQEASKAAERAVELEPNKAANYSQLAYAYFLIDEQEKAEASAKKAIALDANNVAAYKVLGNLYAKQGKQAESDQMFEEAIHANGRVAAASPVVATKNLPGMSPVASENPASGGAKAASGARAAVPATAAAAAAAEPETPQGKDEITAFLDRQWIGMKESMIHGNIPKALTYYSDYDNTREKYRAAFEKMKLSRIKQIYSNMSDIEECEIALLAATCNVTISANGSLHVAKVRFERNEDKIWRIRSY